MTSSYKIKKYLLLFAMALLFLQISNGQQIKIDSIGTQINQLRSEINFTPNDTTYINLLNALGNEIRFYKADSLLHLSKQAFKYSNSTSYKLGEANALMGLGDYYSDKGDHSTAISNYKKALDLSLKGNYTQLVLTARNKLSGEYNLKGDYAKALSGHLENIELAEQTNSLLMLSITNENIANLYTSQKDYKQALEFYKKVKKINEKLRSDIFSAETMSNMASLYADMGELEYAMFNVNSSISVFEKNKILDWLAYAYGTKGKIYLKKQKLDWALYWYKQSEMLHTKLQDERGEIELLNGMAETYLGLEKYNKSQEYALKAFHISKKINFIEGIQKCAKTLYKIDKNKENFASALKYHEIYQKMTDTLSRNENKKSLTMLKTKLAHDKQKRELIQENEKALAQQRNYVYTALGILIVFLTITLMVKRNERIQRNLNTELKTKTQDLENNEKELTENNLTKDKLFSIIGHDLRGPIGAFQGLLKLFKDNEIDQNEFLNFIPKLRMDIDHISFTLNNLLTWGQTQMNGAVTKQESIALENLVLENINLLSEIAENKNIKLVNKISANTLTWSDRNQIDIVIRNLISNALKFTPKHGIVTIEAVEKNEHWLISVRDTGVGMNKATIASIFEKNSNITTYGTNNEKGTGLGLSLCKEMVENNKGTIWVTSDLRIGSCFYFTLQKSKKIYSQTA
ncbi:ATP-binding protein [Kriegella aquimaris]|uniref:ATP-binding protein n=1 Tax=Kriegella aquimaris TaxID=192904 RepID=UPI001FDFEFF7|nr:tetratricopeptide repeat-containing sensor histidine kinase [Kriegella aquimaris]